VVAEAFAFETLPGRVVFGVGARHRLGEEVARLGAARVLIIATPGRRAMAEAAAETLGARAAGIHDRAEMHVPRDSVEAAQAVARDCRADAFLAIGGGSAIGLGKALAHETGYPLLAMPTTYSGSEMTPILGLTEQGVKRTLRDPAVLPRSVLYDPELTLDLPPAVAGPSGLNAIAHGVEALYAENANPFVSALAEEGIRALAGALPAIARRPDDLAARTAALSGAWLCGAVLGSVGMALHHKLCHVLGGSFGLPHAETHGVVLPQVAAFNTPAAPAAMARVARALGVTEAAAGLFDLAEGLGAPRSLAELGLQEGDIERAVEIAGQAPYHNPRPAAPADLRRLLEDAYRGRRPEV
jgi:alcohol dehydrogenase class IV